MANRDGRATTHDGEMRKRIAGRAFELYLARGREPGHALDDWLQAEAEVTAGGTQDVPVLAQGPNVPLEGSALGDRAGEVMTDTPGAMPDEGGHPQRMNPNEG